MSKMIFKGFTIKAQSVDVEQRIVEGYASTWDLDQVDDMIHPGAFAKTIAERGAKVKLLRDHEDPIGKPIEMREDEKGLYVRARISNTPLGEETLQLAKDGVIDSFSIGFSIPEGKYEIDEAGVRHIYEVKLFEFSLVTFPANELAVLTAVKNLRDNAGSGKIDIKALALALGIDCKDITSEPPEKENEPDEFEDIVHSLSEMKTFAQHRLY